MSHLREPSGLSALLGSDLPRRSASALLRMSRKCGVAWAFFAVLGLLSTSVSAITINEAKNFWKDLDDHTLDAVGPRVNQIYGVVDPSNPAQLADAKRKAHRDIFDSFGDAAQQAIANETLEAHGKVVPMARQTAVTNAYKKLKDDGVLDRLSRLQLAVIKDHFNTGGNVDFAKFQEAVELFANGELNAGANPRDMNQLHQWYVWKQFAREAIRNNVNKADWEKILKSLENGLEIFERVYPGRDPAVSGQLKLTDSTPDRFNAALRFTAAEKQALRQAIDGLTTDQVITRELRQLKGVTLGAAAPVRMPEDIRFARLDVNPFGNGLFVNVEVMVTDGFGMPVIDTLVDLIVREISVLLLEDAYSLGTALAHIGSGLYAAEFFTPVVETGLSFFALEHSTLISVAQATQAAPEPGTLLLFGTVAVVLLVNRRRRSQKTSP